MKKDEESIKKLLELRFEVINIHPNCDLKKGDILSSLDSPYNTCYKFNSKKITHIYLPEIEKYPHLFKKLKWYEKRLQNEMPMYLKHSKDKNNYSYCKIQKWDMQNNFGFIDIESKQGCSLNSFSPKYNYLPITEDEYNQNNKTKPKENESHYNDRS